MSGSGSVIQLLLVGTVCALLVWAAASDLQRYVIPNRICAALIILYPAQAVTLAPIDIAIAAGIAGGVLAIGTGLFAFGIMGGGDVKLMAAMSLWAGGSFFVPFLLLTAAAGGLLALWWHPVLQYLFPGTPSMKAANGRPAIPYGAAIAVGGLLVAVNLL